MTYFIKLSGRPSLPSADPLSFKIKYERSQDPTPDNPLNGLFDYTGVAKSIDEHPRDPHALESRLHDQIQWQEIRQGKYKFFQKLADASATAAGRPGGTTARPADELRLEGRMGGVRIDHAHFLDHQKNSETGVSEEDLRWVVKLKAPSTDPQHAALKAALNDPSLRAEIEENVRTGLEGGHALELVNDANKAALEYRLRGLLGQDMPVKLALQRPGLLRDTLVVVGENTVLKPDSDANAEKAEKAEKDPGRPRKYRDFSSDTLAPPGKPGSD